MRSLEQVEGSLLFGHVLEPHSRWALAYNNCLLQLNIGNISECRAAGLMHNNRYPRSNRNVENQSPKSHRYESYQCQLTERHTMRSCMIEWGTKSRYVAADWFLCKMLQV